MRGDSIDDLLDVAPVADDPAAAEAPAAEPGPDRITPPPPPAEAGQPAPRPRATNLAEARILVLDDDPTMRSAVSTMLKTVGCRDVDHTGSGEDALRRIAREPCDLILCDWRMPAMDGLTFLQRLREMPGGAEVPVLILSANQDPKDAWDARRLDVAGWLLKPVAPQSVVAEVAAILGGLAPRVKEDVLDQLLARYEQALPEEVARLQALVGEWDAEAPGFRDRMEVVLRRMHQVKGQAGTMGYALLGDLGGVVHDALQVAAEGPPQALEPHRAELVRLARVATAGMRLVADRRLRGDGGAAGEKMRTQLGGFATGLQAKLAETAAKGAGRRPGPRRG
jgi:CheY-like chemotaxis protein